MSHVHCQYVECSHNKASNHKQHYTNALGYEAIAQNVTPSQTPKFTNTAWPDTAKSGIVKQWQPKKTTCTG
jgi:hypothetical protein